MFRERMGEHFWLLMRSDFSHLSMLLWRTSFAS